MFRKRTAILTAAVMAASMLCQVPSVSAESYADDDDWVIVKKEINAERILDDPETPFDDWDLYKSCYWPHGEEEVTNSGEITPQVCLYYTMKMEAESVWEDLTDWEDDCIYEEKYTQGLCSLRDKDEAIELYHTFLNDNPQFFFLQDEPEIDDTYFRVMIRPEYKSVEARRKAKQQILDYVNSATAEINELETTYEKVAALHDKIVGETELIESCSTDDEDDIMDVINKGKATPGAYTRAMNLVLNYIRIDNYNIEGKQDSGQRKIWNLVRLDDDKYYYVDCASDDEDETDKYLFAGSGTFSDRTVNSPDKTGADHSIIIPAASTKDYDRSVVARTLPEGFNEREFMERISKRYGYDYLGTVENGESMQKLYEAMYDTALEWWHRKDDTLPRCETFPYKDYGITSSSEVNLVITCITSDNPQFFYLDRNGWSYTSEGVKLSMRTDYMYSNYRLNAEKDMINYVLRTAPELEKLDTDYEKVLAYHDKLIEDVEYDLENMSRQRNHNVLGAILDGVSVCEGYSYAFDMMMNYVGVDSLFVVAPAHAWNMVKLDDGKYYYLDITVDDSTSSKKYFCVGSENFAIDAGDHHTPFGPSGFESDFLGQYAVPEGSKTDFDPSKLPEYKKNRSAAGYGDVNRDGKIDIEDAVMVINHINGLKPLTYRQTKYADINGSKNIDIEDAVGIIAYINGVSTF